MNQIEKRKNEHINLALDPNSQILKEPFLSIELPYKTLPEINLSKVSTEVKLFNKKLSQPLIIASMTGGTAKAKLINQNISIAASETGVAFGVGSQRITLKNEDAKESFSIVRRNAPNSVIFANMGAVQLNYEANYDDYQRIVDLIEADALYLHLNALQEAVQPEGDTNFEALIEKIGKLVTIINVPVFVKEVGHGIDLQTAKNLIEIGIKGIDVAGANGTSWAWIDAKRKTDGHFSEWFKDFGISTEQSLKNISEAKKMFNKSEVTVVASGGIRNPIQALKARTLEADFYSAAYPFLAYALEESPNNLIEYIKEWQRGMQIAMFCTGQSTWNH